MAEKCKPAGLRCPNCDAEIAEAAWPYCQACEAELTYCPHCQKPLGADADQCPYCGADVSGEES